MELGADAVDAGGDEAIQGLGRLLKQLRHGLAELVVVGFEALLEIVSDGGLDAVMDIAALRRQVLHGLSPAEFPEPGAVRVVRELQDGTALMPDVSY